MRHPSVYGEYVTRKETSAPIKTTFFSGLSLMIPFYVSIRIDPGASKWNKWITNKRDTTTHTDEPFFPKECSLMLCKKCLIEIDFTTSLRHGVEISLNGERWRQLVERIFMFTMAKNSNLFTQIKNCHWPQSIKALAHFGREFINYLLC